MTPACRWLVAPSAPPALVDALPDVHPVVVGILYRRGLSDPDAVRVFLDRAPGADNPFTLADMNAAVSRLRAAIRDGEPIVVYGDYDADGVTATAVLLETLGALGARVSAFIPQRDRDGYGLHVGAVDALAAAGARLVVTVDCGVRAAPEIAHAAGLGLDVVVTDHHALGETLPDACAVVNPRRPDCRYGFDDLSGVGLAYKLAQGLLRVANRTEPGTVTLAEEDLLDLVAIGTVADVVPLVGENRSLVDRGLVALRAARRPGIRALLDAAGRPAEALSARDLAFVVGPRINAAGRMADARLALDLLLARDPRVAADLAGQRARLNADRRAATDTALTAAERALIGRTGDPFLMHAAPDIALGVTGLVAGRLTNTHYRPSAVVRLEGELARGSARSIPEFNIIGALDSLRAMLVRYGGHARAAGFTVRVSDLGALNDGLTALAGQALDGLDLRPALEVDAEIRGSDIGWPLFEALEGLEPVGEANPRPLLVWRNAPVSGARQVGNGHLRFVAEGGPGVGSIDAIAFNAATQKSELGPRADLVFALRANVWQGVRRLELNIEDMADPA
jgi:single-stranded-DNA-specific exonuclease